MNFLTNLICRPVMEMFSFGLSNYAVGDWWFSGCVVQNTGYKVEYEVLGTEEKQLKIIVIGKNILQLEEARKRFGFYSQNG